MENLLQKALKDGKETLSSLETKYFIKVKRHPLFNNLVMLKYNQINSPVNELTKEARGLILDENNNWKIVAWPFSRFFNYGEGLAAVLDWSKAKVMEKLDGSFMIMYFWNGTWQVASSGLPDAGGQLNNYATTFKELFWKIWNENRYELPQGIGWTHYTFMFEMMSPYNRVVVPHTESKLTLIGVRNCETGDELDPVNAIGFDWPVVKSFPLQTMEDVCQSFLKFDGIDQEGYVVFDGINRIKVKHPGYVAIHHLKGDDGPSHKKMFKIVCTGESSEVLNYFPEWQPIYEEVSEVFEATLVELDKDYARITKDIEFYEAGFKAGGGATLPPAKLQKEFASMAVKTKCPDALFKMRAGKISNFREYFSNIGVDHCMKIMGKREWSIDVP